MPFFVDSSTRSKTWTVDLVCLLPRFRSHTPSAFWDYKLTYQARRKGGLYLDSSKATTTTPKDRFGAYQGERCDTALHPRCDLWTAGRLCVRRSATLLRLCPQSCRCENEHSGRNGFTCIHGLDGVAGVTLSYIAHDSALRRK